jgi:hypothetical protein
MKTLVRAFLSAAMVLTGESIATGVQQNPPEPRYPCSISASIHTSYPKADPDTAKPIPATCLLGELDQVIGHKIYTANLLGPDVSASTDLKLDQRNFCSPHIGAIDREDMRNLPIFLAKEAVSETSITINHTPGFGANCTPEWTVGSRGHTPDTMTVQGDAFGITDADFGLAIGARVRADSDPAGLKYAFPFGGDRKFIAAFDDDDQIRSDLESASPGYNFLSFFGDYFQGIATLGSERDSESGSIRTQGNFATKNSYITVKIKSQVSSAGSLELAPADPEGALVKGSASLTQNCHVGGGCGGCSANVRVAGNTATITVTMRGQTTITKYRAPESPTGGSWVAQ